MVRSAPPTRLQDDRRAELDASPSAWRVDMARREAAGGWRGEGKVDDPVAFRGRRVAVVQFQEASASAAQCLTRSRDRSTSLRVAVLLALTSAGVATAAEQRPTLWCWTSNPGHRLRGAGGNRSVVRRLRQLDVFQVLSSDDVRRLLALEAHPTALRGEGRAAWSARRGVECPQRGGGERYPGGRQAPGGDSTARCAHAEGAEPEDAQPGHRGAGGRAAPGLAQADGAAAPRAAGLPGGEVPRGGGGGPGG